MSQIYDLDSMVDLHVHEMPNRIQMGQISCNIHVEKAGASSFLAVCGKEPGGPKLLVGIPQAFRCMLWSFKLSSNELA